MSTDAKTRPSLTIAQMVQVRLLHAFDFAEGLISRESAWLDIAALQQQLAG